MGCWCGKTEDPNAGLGYDVAATGGREHWRAAYPTQDMGSHHEEGSQQAGPGGGTNNSSRGCGETDKGNWREGGTEREQSTDEDEDVENADTRFRCMVWGYEEAGARRGGARSPPPDPDCVSDTDANLSRDDSSDGHLTDEPEHGNTRTSPSEAESTAAVRWIADEVHEKPPKSGQGKHNVTHHKPGPQAQKLPRERRAVAKKGTTGKAGEAVEQIKKKKPEPTKRQNSKNGPGPGSKDAPQQRPSGLRSALLRGQPR
eukprot:TRINITY_DN5750_c0_g3_i1.p2 TRINITY_DN5750_c0_g3~~TRINITY_DN5750_c0_g3_i1.p2  ORF type:complete len:258 (+),score=72.08 TRINITY_DN5750_c0_g3_i1:90-863(+)